MLIIEDTEGFNLRWLIKKESQFEVYLKVEEGVQIQKYTYNLFLKLFIDILVYQECWWSTTLSNLVRSSLLLFFEISIYSLLIFTLDQTSENLNSKDIYTHNIKFQHFADNTHFWGKHYKLFTWKNVSLSEFCDFAKNADLVFIDKIRVIIVNSLNNNLWTRLWDFIIPTSCL